MIPGDLHVVPIAEGLIIKPAGAAGHQNTIEVTPWQQDAVPANRDECTLQALSKSTEVLPRDADDAPPPPRPSGGASLRPSKKEDALRLLEQVVPRTARGFGLGRASIDSQATGRRPAPRVLREVRRGAQLRGRRRRRRVGVPWRKLR